MKTMYILVTLFFLSLLIISGCKAASVWKDGVFQGSSGEDDAGAYGEVTITIKDGKISGCEFITRQKDGSIKDEEYGKVNGEISNRDFYNKAQLAVQAMKQYAEQFRATASLDKVDAVSGATIAWEQFREAAGNALDAAKGK